MTSVTEEMIEAVPGRITDERLTEILAATQGVTPGPWQVYTKEHPWALPEREFLGGTFPASTGTHKERFVLTTWQHPQAKAEVAVIGGSIGVGVDKPVHMVHIEEADAAHLANCDPQTIAALVTELQAARAALEAALSASPAAQKEVVKCASCGQPPFAYPCQMQGCPHQWPGTDTPAAPQPTEPSRYHFTNETPFVVMTAEGEKKLGAGWLVISEEEYLALSAPAAPQPTEPVAVKLDRDALAELLSRAGAPPGPPDGPIRALPESHFERVRAYKQADAVLSALAPPADLQQRHKRKAEIIEWCADEIMVLAQSLAGNANRDFNSGDQGSAIINRFMADGIKSAVGLLRDKAAALSSERKGQSKAEAQ